MKQTPDNQARVDEILGFAGFMDCETVLAIGGICKRDITQVFTANNTAREVALYIVVEYIEPRMRISSSDLAKRIKKLMFEYIW